VFEGGSRRRRGALVDEEVGALAREGVRLVDIAVLYRSNAQSRVLEHALFGAAIPTASTAGCASSSAPR
jgi:DNA helicase-2/ATP-dependent DNA helicase PcrA